MLKSAIPEVRDKKWPLGDIDQYILAGLEKSSLRPSADADRYTWLRRVSLDVTGLPPTLAEIQNFLDDHSDQAWERVIDRLLASHAFGERWARAWLDLVGYADQIGSANDVPADHAWRYRDYVIRAFNADKPFNDFVHEQVAGDLLPASQIEQRQDQIVATGFLVLGNVNIVEADKLIMRMDLVDLQIDKVGKAFLGMTLSCARCHDHKFDPVTQRDYYGLAGIFASTDCTYKAERGLWSSVTKSSLPETLEQFTHREAALNAHDRKIAAVKTELATLKASLEELNPSGKTAPAMNSQPAASVTSPEAEQKKKALMEKMRALNKKLWHLNYLRPLPPVAFSVRESAETADARMQVRGNPHVLGTVVPRGFVEVATQGTAPTIPQGKSGRRELAEWLTGAASPLVARIAVNRIWSRLFGRGIVGSVDYFGARGERPTHPELLDLLAAQFIRDGWSQKRIIRRLALSRAYRQTSDVDKVHGREISVDPDNRLLWRMTPRRLEAEMLRDSALALGGTLLACNGGPGLAPEFAENVGGLDPTSVNPISFSLTKFRDEQWRVRTVYLPVVRSTEQQGPAEVLNFFDFALPARVAGERPTTAVASQTLFLLNGPLLKEATRSLAASLMSDGSFKNEDGRLAAAYLKVLGRPPAPEEIASARRFLDNAEALGGKTSPADANLARWQRFLHALMASNEFLFRL